MAERFFRQMTTEEIRRWYATDFTEAFEENERKPLADILSLMELKRYEIWGLFQQGLMLGYVALWKREGIPLVLLDYLGVSAALRNGGIGTYLLELLKTQGFPIVTESETSVAGDSEAANSIRTRRIGFYRRNGFIPAYEMATCGMKWQALLANTDSMELADIMRWHRELYGSERTDVRIPLGQNEIPEMPYWIKCKEQLS